MEIGHRLSDGGYNHSKRCLHGMFLIYYSSEGQYVNCIVFEECNYYCTLKKTGICNNSNWNVNISKWLPKVVVLPVCSLYLSGPLSPNTCGSHDISEHWLKVKHTLIKLNFKLVVIVNGTWQDKIIWSYLLPLLLALAVPNINVITETRRAHWIWYQHFYY